MGISRSSMLRAVCLAVVLLALVDLLVRVVDAHARAQVSEQPALRAPAHDEPDAPVALDDDERVPGPGRARHVHGLAEATHPLQPDRGGGARRQEH